MTQNHTAQKISIIGSLTLLLAATLTATAAEPDTIGWFRRTFVSLTWNEAETAVQTPKDASYRVRSHVDYVEDLGDTLKSPQDTWESATGDCEDFAACVVELCRQKGFKAWIQVFFEAGNGEAHAVAMGNWNGKLWVSSNGYHRTVKSEAHAAKRVADQMGWNSELVSSMTWDESQGSVSSTAAR